VTLEYKNQKYIDYIKKASDGKNRVKIEWFDENWKPIGPLVRKQLYNDGKIYQMDGMIYLKKG